jgi:hypothetical protein
MNVYTKIKEKYEGFDSTHIVATVQNGFLTYFLGIAKDMK